MEKITLNKNSLSNLILVTHQLVSNPISEIQYIKPYLTKKQNSNSYNKFNLQTYAKKIQLRKRIAEINISNDKIRNLNFQNIITDTVLKDALLNEIDILQHTEFIKELNRVSSDYIKYTLLDKILIFLYNLFKKSYKKTIKIKNSNDLRNLIMNMNKDILENIRIEMPNYIIIPPSFSTYFKNIKDFISCPSDNYNKKILLEKIGSLYFTDIYVNSLGNLSDNTIYMGSKFKNQHTGIQQHFLKDGTFFTQIAQIDQKTQLPGKKLLLQTSYFIGSIDDELSRKTYKKVNIKIKKRKRK